MSIRNIGLLQATCGRSFAYRFMYLSVAALLLAVLPSCSTYTQIPCTELPLDPPVAVACAETTNLGVKTDARLQYLGNRRWRLVIQDLEDPAGQNYLFTDLARKTCTSGFKRLGESRFTTRRGTTSYQDDPFNAATAKNRRLQYYIAWKFECPNEDWNGKWPAISGP